MGVLPFVTMNKYFVLTEEGVRTVEALRVDENTFDVRFIAPDATVTLPRNAVLWWSPVEQPPFAGWAEPRAPHRPRHAHDVQIARSEAASLALARAVIACVPRDWVKAAVELNVARDYMTGELRTTHRIFHPDSGVEVMNFSEALFTTITVYQRISEEQSQKWKQCTMTLNLEKPGKFRPVTRFSY